jgi:hypothetical protein
MLEKEYRGMLGGGGGGGRRGVNIGYKTSSLYSHVRGWLIYVETVASHSDSFGNFLSRL